MTMFDPGKLRVVSLSIRSIACDCQVRTFRMNQRVGDLITFRGHNPPGSAVTTSFAGGGCP
jgi:hypothetical protein